MLMPTQDGEQLAMRWMGCETPVQARSSHACCLPVQLGHSTHIRTGKDLET